MRSSAIAFLAVLTLVGGHAPRGGETAGNVLVRSAYEDATQRYQDGEAVRHSVAPQHAQPLADGAAATGVDNGRLV